MGKVTKVKWALGGDEPEDLAEFLTNEDIVKKHGMPPKGVYKFAVRRLSVKPNRNGDDRISVMLVMREPKGSKSAKWNGYLVWDGLNVTEQAAPFIKRFLKGLGLSWSDFMTKTKQDDQDPPHIIQIGGVKFEQGKDPIVRASVKIAPADDWNDDDHLEITRYLPLEDEDEVEDEVEEDEEVESFDEDVDDDEDDSEDEEDEDEEDEEDEDEEDEEDEDEPDEDEVEELTEELNGLKIAALKKRALRNDKKADLDGMKKADLVALIVEQELGAPPF